MIVNHCSVDEGLCHCIAKIDEVRKAYQAERVLYSLKNPINASVNHEATITVVGRLDGLLRQVRMPFFLSCCVYWFCSDNIFHYR